MTMEENIGVGNRNPPDNGYYQSNYTADGLTADIYGNLEYTDYEMEFFYGNLSQDWFLPDPLPLSWRRIILFFYLVIITLAVVGNVIVILVITKNAKLQTITNRFLLSLAVSDLCMAILTMPFNLLFYMKNEWMLGEFTCKFTSYLQAVFIVSTILTLTVVAVDRYYAILFPLKVRHIHTSTRSIVVIAIIWITSLLIVSPQVAIQRLRVHLTNTDEDEIPRIAHSCVEHIEHSELKKAYSIGIFIVLYIAPVVIMIFAYGAIVLHLRKRQPIGETARSLKERRRYLAENKSIIRMLIIIVMCFVLAWFPFFSCQLYLLFYKHNSQSKIIFAIFNLIGYSNACVNPIIYCFLNENFRICMKALILHPCGYRRSGFSQTRLRLSNRISTTSTTRVIISESTNV